MVELDSSLVVLLLHKQYGNQYENLCYLHKVLISQAILAQVIEARFRGSTDKMIVELRGEPNYPI